ncbi:hypothetical protein MFLAVUS_001804 [Mucor flavus]|uniref:Peroxisomal membrane protein PEX14 n=2 Tax=Mucor flavus TaxID=439312 RepID=A0ABP9YNH3_9FUNG
MSDSPKPDNQPPTVESTPVVAPTPATTTTTTTAVTEPQTAIVSPLREDLIKSAVSFLSSANVRSADKGKKVAFLQKKGLNQAEIDEAFKRAGNDEQAPSAVTATTTTNNNYIPPSPPQAQHAPVLPSRNINYGPPQIVYYPQPPNPPVPVEKVFAMAVVLGMGAVGLTAGVIGILRRFIAPIFNRIAEYQRTRYNQRKEIADKLAKSIKSFHTENDDLDALIDQGDENTVVDALVKHQTDLSTKIEQLVAVSRERLAAQLKHKTYDDFRTQLTGLRNVMNDTNPYNYNSYHPGSHFNRQGGDSPAVSGLKSDIRSLKAVLLNRRNFPTA